MFSQYEMLLMNQRYKQCGASHILPVYLLISKSIEKEILRKGKCWNNQLAKGDW